MKYNLKVGIYKEYDNRTGRYSDGEEIREYYKEIEYFYENTFVNYEDLVRFKNNLFPDEENYIIEIFPSQTSPNKVTD